MKAKELAEYLPSLEDKQDYKILLENIQINNRNKEIIL